jgi:hypothetical protein
VWARMLRRPAQPSSIRLRITSRNKAALLRHSLAARKKGPEATLRALFIGAWGSFIPTTGW